MAKFPLDLKKAYRKIMFKEVWPFLRTKYPHVGQATLGHTVAATSRLVVDILISDDDGALDEEEYGDAKTFALAVAEGILLEDIEEEF